MQSAVVVIRAGVLAAVIGILSAGAALAHHGWAWTSGGNIELTGEITAANLGNPHGEVTVSAEGETWTVEVGQPWRNERAGLTDEMFTAGNEMTFIGEPSANVQDRLLKAERIVINGQTYDLYPGRN